MRIAAVQFVAEDWETILSGVNADLMGASSFGTRDDFISANFELRFRFGARMRSALAHVTIPDTFKNRPHRKLFLRRRFAALQNVFFANRSFGELLGQRTVGLLSFAKDQNARSFFV